MHYDAQLDFVNRLLHNFHIHTTIINSAYQEIPEFDLGLRRMIYNETDYKKLFTNTPPMIQSNTIYRIQDPFFCNYICIQLPYPGKPPCYLFIGPYSTREITKHLLLNLAERLTLSPQKFNELQKFYTSLIMISDEDALFSLATTLGEYLWGGLENFTVETIDNRLSDNTEPITSRSDMPDTEDAFFAMENLEKRYEAENLLIHAISQGLVHKAEMALTSNSFLTLEQRVPDPVRNIKNYCIIMNTLLRKGAEQGSVHPIHIDNLSSRFARKIEQITTPEGGTALQKEMIHKYCLLVKNHSMKGFSLLVQKVVTRIDSDLTADLSLKTQAQLLNVNASYLSTLFKKETGMTFTDYVNKKRMENAVFLLNSTNMQIQNIAQYCGIPDVNYFTKIFKKYIGKTPKEYRGEIS